LVRWISRGREKRWPMQTGAVNFFPRDGEQHTFVLTRQPFLEMPVFLIPEAHFRICMDADHCDSPAELRHDTFPHDAVLQACLQRLARHSHPDAGPDALSSEEAARKLVLRLARLCGGGQPEWQADTAGFDRRTLTYVVDYIDAHLQPAPALGDIALAFGLSPSHFARKFRQSTGLSLHRFINRRRIQRSLEALKNRAESLAGVSVQLGFSSQSHFTRLFSSLTGMTPAKYQKCFQPTVG